MSLRLYPPFSPSREGSSEAMSLWLYALFFPSGGRGDMGEHSVLCSSPPCRDESARDLSAQFPSPLRGGVRGGVIGEA
jgi:hypothetical protein